MDVRIKGLIKLVGGAIGAVPLMFILYRFGWYPATTSRDGIDPMIVLALPGAFAVAGLVEFVSGVPFNELRYEWVHLEIWQRAALVLLMVGACFGLMLAGAMFFA